jgi:hypothetical protein
MMEVTGPDVPPYNGNYQSLGIYEIEGTKLIGWGGPGAIKPPIAYYHVNEAGERQEGLFLGYNNITAWGIKHHEARKDCVGTPAPYFSIRLLENEDPDSSGELAEGESATFLKVVGS